MFIRTTDSDIDISCIVTLHNEGCVAFQALNSVRLAIQELGPDVRCEIVVSLDNADNATRQAVQSFSHDDLIVHEWQFGELSAARNESVSVSRGQYVALLDGDDLWSPNWLVRALSAAQSSGNPKEVYHSQFNLYFGRGAQNVFEHVDSESTEFCSDFARHANCWTALSFANRSIYRKFPYQENEIVKGFGYEDWTWNIQLLDAGFRHRVVTDTVHFIRQDAYGGSLSDRTRRHHAIPRVKALYKVA